MSVQNGCVLWPYSKAMTGFWQRCRGMIGEPEPTLSHAFWFPKCRAVHSFGMKAAIDLIAVDKELRLLAVERHFCPGRSIRFKGCYGIIELAASSPWPLESWIGQQFVFIAQGERINETTKLSPTDYFGIALKSCDERVSANEATP